MRPMAAEPSPASDPTKVDRSAAYMARYIAKNIVAAGLAERCEIELAYAIGVAQPASVLIDTAGTGKLPDSELEKIIRSRLICARLPSSRR